MNDSSWVFVPGKASVLRSERVSTSWRQTTSASGVRLASRWAMPSSDERVVASPRSACPKYRTL